MREFDQMPDQMPGLLARVDDPWGIAWRVRNAIRRFSVVRAARLVAGMVRGVSHERPVLVVGVPRSGTTVLYHVLSQSLELGSLGHEAHDLWRTFHHPRVAGWRSDVVGPGQVRFGEGRYVHAYLYAHGIRTRRFVEKTPCNALRVPYLLDLFPDCTIVVMKRNPADVVNSLINGWRHPAGRYRNYIVPATLAIPGYPWHRRWCFTLIEGWRDLVHATVPEIAFAQWESMTRALVEARRLVPEERWQEVHLERLVHDPEGTLGKLCDGIGVAMTPAMRDRAAELAVRPVNALSAPTEGKWRGTNRAEIEPLLPRMIPLARTVGYVYDERADDFVLIP